MRKRLSVLLSVAMVTGAVGVLAPAGKGHTGHTVTVSDMSVSEASSVGHFTLSLSQAPEQGETLSVRAYTSNGFATGTAGCPPFPPGASNQDYVNVDTVVTWNTGETNKSVNVPICNDSTTEADESFFLNIADAAGAGFTCNAPCQSSARPAIIRHQGVGTIVDDEGKPSISIGDASLGEGHLGSTAFVFAVTLGAASNQTVTVRFATADGTAGSGDYLSQSGTVTFLPGQTAHNITVPVSTDTTPELDETFFVNLSGPTNAQVVKPQGVGMILNDDVPLPPGDSVWTINDVSRPEGNDGRNPTTPFTFTVTLSQPQAVDRTVNVFTFGGAASPGIDYDSVSRELTIPANRTAAVVTVPVVGDTAPESNETFVVNLSSPSVGALAKAAGNGTIADDDTPDPTPTPTPSPSPDGGVKPTLKIGGYFQARVTAPAPCYADRLIKIKRTGNKVILEGRTDANGLLKEKVRPRKPGNFYAQVYNTTIDEVFCPGGKSPVRRLPA